MSRILRALPLLFIFAVCCSPSFTYARSHDFQTGKLINVTTDERLDDGTSYRRAIFTVQIGDIIYTLKGDRVRLRTKDYAQGLIVGDPIQASVEGKDMFLQKSDGKDYKTSILKRERIPQR